MIVDGFEFLPAPPDLARTWVLYQAAFRHWEEAATGSMRPVPASRTFAEWLAAPPDARAFSRASAGLYDALLPLMGRLRRDEQALAEALCMDAPHIESQFFRPFPNSEGYRIPGLTWHHAGVPIGLPHYRTRWDWRYNVMLPPEVRPRTFGDCFP
jgi:hypothetical protein